MPLSHLQAFRRRAHGPLSSLWLTLAIMLPISLAVGDHGWLFSVVALLGAGVVVFTLCAVLPHGPVFALSVVTGVAVYICLYTIISRSAFPAAIWWVEALAFTLPPLGFSAAVLVRRQALAVPLEASAHDGMDVTHLARFVRWLSLSALIATASLALPLNRMPAEGQSLALVLAMVLVAWLAIASLRDVLLLLGDVAAILTFVGTRMRFLAAPMVTYTMMFSLMTVAFGCAYRIADGMSRPPLFQRFGEPGKIDFAEAMHFSVVTLATVGYGDILPTDNGVRLMATVQMLMGQLLLLFGFAEIMRQRVDPRG